jgi:hypothetical protein
MIVPFAAAAAVGGRPRRRREPDPLIGIDGISPSSTSATNNPRNRSSG